MKKGSLALCLWPSREHVEEGALLAAACAVRSPLHPEGAISLSPQHSHRPKYTLSSTWAAGRPNRIWGRASSVHPSHPDEPASFSPLPPRWASSSPGLPSPSQAPCPKVGHARFRFPSRHSPSPNHNHHSSPLPTMHIDRVLTEPSHHHHPHDRGQLWIPLTEHPVVDGSGVPMTRPIFALFLSFFLFCPSAILPLQEASDVIFFCAVVFEAQPVPEGLTNTPQFDADMMHARLLLLVHLWSPRSMLPSHRDPPHVVLGVCTAWD